MWSSPADPHPGSYPLVWRWCAGIVVGAELVRLAVVEPSGVVTLAGGSAFISSCVALGVAMDDRSDGDTSSRRSVLESVFWKTALVCLAVGTLLFGYFALAGLVGLAAIASPIAVRALSRADAGLSDGDVEDATTSELVDDWQRSYALLKQTRDPGSAIRLVEIRQAYLDELESRDPDALQAWLRTHPEPGDGPVPGTPGTDPR